MFFMAMDTKKDRVLEGIDRLLIHERDVLERLRDIKSDIYRASELLFNCNGRIVVSGLGKSGYAARKIAATLSSVGHPSIFIHPTEALHGDFGAILEDDRVIVISKSGETVEVLELMAMIKPFDLRTVSITTNGESSLARAADVSLVIPQQEEGDPLAVVPTTSVIATIAIGDAIASALMVARETTYEKFRSNHPGGALGRRLSKVSQLMHREDEIPIVALNATLKEAIIENSKKGLGFVLLGDEKKLHILTDGDIRRAITTHENPLSEHALLFSSPDPKSVSPDILAEEALAVMEKHRITSLIIRSQKGISGVIHMHDILGQRFI